MFFSLTLFFKAFLMSLLVVSSLLLKIFSAPVFITFLKSSSINRSPPFLIVVLIWDSIFCCSFLAKEASIWSSILIEVSSTSIVPPSLVVVDIVTGLAVSFSITSKTANFNAGFLPNIHPNKLFFSMLKFLTNRIENSSLTLSTSIKSTFLPAAILLILASNWGFGSVK